MSFTTALLYGAFAFVVLYCCRYWLLAGLILAGVGLEWLTNPAYREACHTKWYSKWRQG